MAATTTASNRPGPDAPESDGPVPEWPGCWPPLRGSDRAQWALRARRCADRSPHPAPHGRSGLSPRRQQTCPRLGTCTASRVPVVSPLRQQRCRHQEQVGVVAKTATPTPPTTLSEADSDD